MARPVWPAAPAGHRAARGWSPAGRVRPDRHPGSGGGQGRGPHRAPRAAHQQPHQAATPPSQGGLQGGHRPAGAAPPQRREPGRAVDRAPRRPDSRGDERVSSIDRTVKRLFVIIMAVSGLLVLSSCGSGIGGGYAARVNGEVIRLSDLNDELAAIRDNKDYQSAISEGGTPVLGKGGKNTFNSAFVARLLTQRVAYLLIGQELRQRHIEVTDADRQQAATDVE